MLTVIAFLVAIGLLIAVHEYGHYRMAVACGVKVLRFSVGFGKTLWRFKPRKQHPGQDTEFIIAAIPFGGYVKMLDEREAPVEATERHRAFNTQPLWARAAIVAAGPLANLALAVVLYTAVNWIGVQEPKAILSSPAAGSVAERAGLLGGEQVVQAAFEGQSLEPVASFEDLRWLLARAALDGKNVVLRLVKPEGGAIQSIADDDAPLAGREVTLALSGLQVHQLDASLLERIGVVAPWSRAVIGQVLPGSAAEKAGLLAQDKVLRVDAQDVADAQQLRNLIVQSGAGGRTPVAQNWQIERAGRVLVLPVTPELQADASQPEGQKIARIGARIGEPPALQTVRHGFWQGLGKAFEKTWDISRLTLVTLGKMLTGQASLKNLSGPLTIADYAGKSASLGLTPYLVFLALISVSLGVLNLLPLPVLDGGHLMYYLWEAATGKSVSDAWMERLQRGGIALLLMMMGVALFNDVVRLLGS